MKRHKGLNFIRLATKDICSLITTEAKQYIDTKGAVCGKGKNKTAQIETRQITTSELLAEGEERLSTKQFPGKIHRTNSACSTLAGKIQVPVTIPTVWEED